MVRRVYRVYNTKHKSHVNTILKKLKKQAMNISDLGYTCTCLYTPLEIRISLFTFKQQEKLEIIYKNN